MSNHLTKNLLSKGLLGGTTALLTKGMITDEIIIITKKGKVIRRGGGVVLGGKGYYDKDYHKRFRRELEEDGDEIEIIKVRIRKKHLPKEFEINVELIKPQVQSELIEMELIDGTNIPKIEIELIGEEKKEDPKINIELIDGDKESKPTIKSKLIDNKKPPK